MSVSTLPSWTWPRPLTLSVMMGCGRACACLAVLSVSALWTGSSVIECLPECKMMVSPVTNGVMQGCVITLTLFSMMFSALLQMLSVTVILEFTLGNSLMGSFSAFRDCKQNPRCRLMSCITFSLKMTVHLMPASSWKSVLYSLQRLWPYNKHKEDWSHVPTCSCCTLHWAHCDKGLWKVRYDRKVHILWQHLI